MSASACKDADDPSFELCSGVEFELLPPSDADSLRAALKATLDTYGLLSVSLLVDVSHREGSPWDNVRQEQGPRGEIGDERIGNYFRAAMAPPEAPVPTGDPANA